MIEKVNPDFPQSMADSYLHHMVEEVMSKNQGQLEKEKVIETGRRIITKYNCRGCHNVEGKVRLDPFLTIKAGKIVWQEGRLFQTGEC